MLNKYERKLRKNIANGEKSFQKFYEENESQIKLTEKTNIKKGFTTRRLTAVLIAAVLIVSIVTLLPLLYNTSAYNDLNINLVDSNLEELNQVVKNIDISILNITDVRCGRAKDTSTPIYFNITGSFENEKNYFELEIRYVMVTDSYKSDWTDDFDSLQNRMEMGKDYYINYQYVRKNGMFYLYLVKVSCGKSTFYVTLTCLYETGIEEFLTTLFY